MYPTKLIIILLCCPLVYCTDEIVRVQSNVTPLKVLDLEGYNGSGIAGIFNEASGATVVLSYGYDLPVKWEVTSTGEVSKRSAFQSSVLPDVEFRDLTIEFVPVPPFALDWLPNGFGLIDGSDFSAGPILLHDIFPEYVIEIRTGPSLMQMAHRFLSPPISSPTDAAFEFSYQDYVEVPFEVWDVTNNRQLMVSFRDAANDGQFTPSSGSNWAFKSWESLYIHDITYAPTADPLITVNGGQLKSLAMQVSPLAIGNWSPDTLPTAAIRITPTTHKPTIFFGGGIGNCMPVYDAELRQYFFLIGWSTNGYRYYGTALVRTDEDFVIKGFGIQQQLRFNPYKYTYFYTSRLNIGSDGAIFSSSSKFAVNTSTQSTVFSISDQNLTLQYETEIESNAFASSNIVEAFGSYYVVGPYAILQLTTEPTNSVKQVREVFYPNVQDVEFWKSRLVVVSLDRISLLDQYLNEVGSSGIVLPNHSGQDVHVYPGKDNMYVIFRENEWNSDNSTLVMYTIDKQHNVSRKVGPSFDFYFEYLSSIVNDDGSAMHLIRYQLINQPQLMLVKTNKQFELDE